MAVKKRHPEVDDLRPEYDLSQMKAVRGKYYERYMEGTNLVLIEPDLYEVFRTGEAVNKALRLVVNARRSRRRKVSPAAKSVGKRSQARR